LPFAARYGIVLRSIPFEKQEMTALGSYAMENPRKSKIKKLRKSGFRRRMKTTKGRKIVNRKRRLKRAINVRKTF
jgi:large subunit ribosomal protein L34